MIVKNLIGNSVKKDQEFLFREKWIRWVLDFSQKDLAKLSSVELRNLKEKVVYFCSDRPNEDRFGELEERSVDFSLLTPGEIEGVTEDEKGNPINLRKLQKGVIYFLNAVNDSTENEPTALPKMSSYIVPSAQGLSIYRYPKTDSPKNWLLLNFVELIQRSRTSPIKKCIGCGRFFSHLTKKEKIYCDSSCAARSIMKIKREKIYQDTEEHEKFNKKAREYQYGRYHDDMKEKLGKNVNVGRKESS
jgi:hypothetical protein